jgi:lipopolysaccharide transport system ATP-binding protein
VFESGAKGELLVWIRFHEDIIRPVFGMTLKTKEGVTLYGINTEIQASTGFEGMGQKGAIVLIRAKLNFNLAGGDYFVSVGIASLSRGADAVPHDRRYDAIHLRVAPTPQFLGLSDLGGALEVASC